MLAVTVRLQDKAIRRDVKGTRLDGVQSRVPGLGFVSDGLPVAVGRRSDRRFDCGAAPLLPLPSRRLGRTLVSEVSKGSRSLIKTRTENALDVSAVETERELTKDRIKESAATEQSRWDHLDGTVLQSFMANLGDHPRPAVASPLASSLQTRD